MEREILSRLKEKTGLQLIDHQLRIELTWNEDEKQLDVDIETEVEFPPIDQEILNQVLTDVLKEVVTDYEDQLRAILKDLKTL